MRIVVDPEQLRAGPIVLCGDEHHYLSRVRRAAVGDELVIFDGAGRQARATVDKILASATVVLASEPELVVDARPRIRVLLPLIKGDRMDTAIEKLVEVGVDELVIWPAERAVVQLDGDRLDARLERFAANALAAARQCGRASVPSIVAARALAAAIASSPRPGFVLVPGAAPPAFAACDHLTLASGPEGGLSPAEVDALVAAGFTPIGLGPRVLRAETAPVIAVALVRAATNS